MPFLRDWFAAGCVLRAWNDPTNLIHNPFPTLPHATIADAQLAPGARLGPYESLRRPV